MAADYRRYCAISRHAFCSSQYTLKGMTGGKALEDAPPYCGTVCFSSRVGKGDEQEWLYAGNGQVSAWFGRQAVLTINRRKNRTCVFGQPER